jgi:tricorn protease
VKIPKRAARAGGGRATADQDKDKNNDKAKEKEAVKVTIDFGNISQRVLALPIPSQRYQGLAAGKEGTLYLTQGAPVDIEPGPPSLSIQRFDLKTRKTEQVLAGIRSFALSDNGEKMLYRQDDNWFIAASDKAPKPGDGQLKIADMEVKVIRGRSGNRCITRSGESSVTSFMTRTTTD